MPTKMMMKMVTPFLELKKKKENIVKKRMKREKNRSPLPLMGFLNKKKNYLQK
jgi:hypothetical protein